MINRCKWKTNIEEGLNKTSLELLLLGFNKEGPFLPITWNLEEGWCNSSKLLNASGFKNPAHPLISSLPYTLTLGAAGVHPTTTSDEQSSLRRVPSCVHLLLARPPSSFSSPALTSGSPAAAKTSCSGDCFSCSRYALPSQAVLE